MLLGTFSHSKEFNEKRQQRNWKENSTILAIKNREKLSGTHTHTHIETDGQNGYKWTGPFNL